MSSAWSQLAPSFPAQAGPAQQARIVELMRVGDFRAIDWQTVEARDDAGNRLVMQTAGDALSLGVPDDSVRVNVSHETAQKIADLMGWVLPTPQMTDLVTRAAPKFIGANAVTWGALWPQEPNTPASTAYMVKHSRAIDARAGGAKFIAGPWKGWHSSRRLEQPELLDLGKLAGLQYGFFDPRAPSKSVTGDFNLWQTPGATHSVTYQDYSEKMRPWLRWAWLYLADGSAPQAVDIADIAIDPDWSHLLSHDGPVALHHPWLPICDPSGDCGDVPGGSGQMPPPGAPPTSPGALPPASAALAYDLAKLSPLAAMALVGISWYLVTA